MISRKLLTKAHAYHVRGQESQAINFLCANGCDEKLACEIIRHFAKGDHYLDRYLVERLLAFLPFSRHKAVKWVKYYYEVDFWKANDIIMSIESSGNVTEAEIIRVLESLNPSRQSDQQPVARPSHGSVRLHIFNLLANGRKAEALQLLSKETPLRSDLAREYVEEVQKGLLRTR